MVHQTTVNVNVAESEDASLQTALCRSRCIATRPLSAHPPADSAFTSQRDSSAPPRSHHTPDKSNQRDALAVLVVALAVVVFNAWAPAGFDPRALSVLAVFALTVAALVASTAPIAVLVLAALLTLSLANAWVCPATAADHAFGLHDASDARLLFAQDPGSRLISPLNASIWKDRADLTFPPTPPRCDSLDDSLKVALGGFSLPLSWLVWSAFNLGLAVEHCGLGRRFALLIVRTFGTSPFTLGPCLFLIELFCGLLIPSNTARGGALIFPLVVSINKTFTNNPTIQRYLILCGLNANLISSSALYYGTVGNPVLAETAEDLLHIEFGFVEWILGASVPILCLLFLLPAAFWHMAGNNGVPSPSLGPAGELSEEDGDTTASSSASVVLNANQELEAMGPINPREKTAGIVLAVCLLSWVLDLVPDAVIGLSGVTAMILAGVVSWGDVRDNGQAWDSFFWLSGMVLIVEQMNKLGISVQVGNWCREVLVDGVGPVTASLYLGVFYFVSMYLFSSITSHIVALSTPLLLAGKAAGCPPLLITALLCYASGLCACLSSYSSGITVMYFSENIFSKREWYMYGIITGILYIFVFGTIGMLWFKFLGWY
ncbi:Sodium/sulfate symporter [Chytriomyces sp. MP71]|nr:Sodium/sulfate symporter [Chytriomyces sp. MP71]